MHAGRDIRMCSRYAMLELTQSFVQYGYRRDTVALYFIAASVFHFETSVRGLSPGHCQGVNYPQTRNVTPHCLPRYSRMHILTGRFGERVI